MVDVGAEYIEQAHIARLNQTKHVGCGIAAAHLRHAADLCQSEEAAGVTAARNTAQIRR